MNGLKEKIDEIKKVIKHQKKHIKKIENSSKKPKYEFFIIAELLATNKIEIQEKKVFIYKEIKYEFGAELSKVINNEFGTKNQAFTQYLNDFRSQAGDKYFLKTSDNEKNLDKRIFEF